MHEGGGRWVGSNKVVELKKNKNCLHQKKFAVSGREGMVREFEMVLYTLLYLKWVTNKDLS